VLEHPAVLLMRSLQSAFLLAAPPTSPKNLNETSPITTDSFRVDNFSKRNS